jgi:hypothetical protein
MATKRGYPTLADFQWMCDTIDDVEFRSRGVEPFFRALGRMYKNNPRIIGHYTTRCSALASFDWKLTSIDVKDQARADAARRRCGSVINEAIINQANTPFLGTTLYEVGYNQGDDGQKMIVKKMYKNTEYDSEYSHVYFPATKKDVDTSTSTDFLLDRYPLPFQGGIMRTFMPTEILRYDMLIENANYLRKLKGILQIVVNGGSGDDQKAAEEAARTMIKDNYVVTGAGIEMKLNEIVKTGGAAFKEFIDMCVHDISIACLGQANVAELPANSGSRAALQVQRMVSADIFYQDMIRVESFVRQILLNDWVVNVDPKATEDMLPYSFKFSLAEEQDIEKNANALEILVKFMAMKRTEAYSLVGLTIPQAGEDLFIPLNAGNAGVIV